MTKHEKEMQLKGLSEAVIIEASIECSENECNHAAGGWFDDEEQAAKDFFDRGWRVDVSDYPYCPRCWKQLKSEKQQP